MSRDLARPMPFAAAARGIFALSLDAMLWTRRSVLMGSLLALPMLFALLYRITLAAKLPAQIGAFDLYGTLVATYYLGNVVPLAALFYATALVSDELEAKTITYLFTRPIPRASILLGKFAAYLVTTLSFALPALLASFFLLVSRDGGAALQAHAADLLRDLLAVSVGFLAYGALFALVGVVLKRPVLAGLIFVFVWEQVANLPGYLKQLTLTAYLRSLVTHRPPEEGLTALFAQAALPYASSLATLIVITLLLLAAATLIFSRREYVLEQ